MMLHATGLGRLSTAASCCCARRPPCARAIARVVASAQWTERAPRRGGGRRDGQADAPFSVGAVVTGTVLNVKPAGATVELPVPDSGDVAEGWLPTRQISQEQVESADAVLEPGAGITAVVIATGNGIILGTKQLEDAPGDMLRDPSAPISEEDAAERAARWLEEHSERRQQQREERAPQSEYGERRERRERGGGEGAYGGERRERREEPSQELYEELQRGSLVTGRVKFLKPYGAFVEMRNGLTGLLHISNISREHVDAMEAVFTPGDEVMALVAEVDVDSRRITLNTKWLEQQPGDMLRDKEQVWETAEEMAANWEDRKGGRGRR